MSQQQEVIVLAGPAPAGALGSWSAAALAAAGGNSEGGEFLARLWEQAERAVEEEVVKLQAAGRQAAERQAEQVRFALD